MARLPYVRREDLSQEGQRVYDYLARSRDFDRPDRPPLPNVWRLWLNHPPAAEAVARLGEYVRFHSTLAPAVMELVTLAAAWEVEGQYPFSRHVPLARKAGVREEAIAAARDGTEDGLTPEEVAVVRFVREMLRDHHVSDATFQDAKGRFGAAGVVDLAVTAGYFALLSLGVNAVFQTDLEPDVQPEL